MEKKVQKTILDNGIRIVSEKIDYGQSVSLGIWVAAGSRNESKELNGISHLLEHMIFKRTDSRSAYDIATSLESLGGSLNAFTDREFTCFYAAVLEENLPQAVDVLGDIIQNAVLDEKDLLNEKQIIFEEIKELEDTPEDFVQDSFVQLIFDDHSLGLSTLGSYESVEKIKRGDLVGYKKKFYTPNNIIVAAAGKVNHDFFVELVQQFFQSFPQRPSTFLEPFKLGNVTFKKINSSIKQTHITTGTLAYSYNDSRKYPLIVLNTVLGGGMSSRLFQNLREKQGLAYSVYSLVDLWSDTGLWSVYIGTSPQNSEKVLKLIKEEFAKLYEVGISAEEFERTKSQLRGNFILNLEDTGSRMNRLAKMELYSQNYVPLDEVISRVEAVSQEDLRSVVHELLDNGKIYTAIIEPE